MQLLLSTFTLLQLSYALHLGPDTELISIQKHPLQNKAGQDPVATVKDAKRPGNSIPWWKLPNTDNGEMNALTGQQFYPFGDDASDNDGAGIPSTNPVCPINGCQSSGVLNKSYCGEHTRCLNGLCQCDFGWKPIEGTTVARGWSGLEALTVWIDANTLGCTQRCDSLSCLEVPQKKGCFDGGMTHSDKSEATNESHTGQEDLETDNLHLGVIKAPTADPSIGG